MEKPSHQGTILVVEDSDAERETLLALLRRTGHTAWGVADSQSAIMSLQELETQVDVVLCDLRLKGSLKTGVDLLREWKRRRPSTPFIFVTGVFEIAQVVEAVKLGAEDYITKPYNSSELLRRVQECIDASRGESATSVVQSTHCEEADDAGFELPVDVPLEQLERVAIECALRRAGGNRTHAAEALRISVRTLQRKLKSWAAEGAAEVSLS